MIQKTFKRYEKKYLLSPQQYRMVRQGIQERMQLDQYGCTPSAASILIPTISS